MKTLKTLFLITAATIASHQAVAQNKSFGIGTATPNPNAVLHLVSPTNNQGLQLPQLTTAQRTAMTLSAADIGLQLYDTDLKGIFVWDGAAWKNGGTSLPYVNSASNASNLIDITNTGTGNVANFAINNATSSAAALNATTNGTGSAVKITSTNAANPADALSVITNGAGDAIYALTTGTAPSGGFNIQNAANDNPAVYGITNGTGQGVVGYSSGSAASSGVYGENFGLGYSGYFNTSNAANANPALYSQTVGTGSAGKFSINNAASTALALDVTSNSLATKGSAASFVSTNTTPGNRATVYVSNVVGSGIYAESATAWPIWGQVTAGQGNAVNGVTTSTDPGSWGGYFSAQTGSAVYATTASNVGGTLAPVGVYGESTGTASVGGAFWVQNATNTYPALYANTVGTGPASMAETATGTTAVYSLQSGTGQSFVANHTGASGQIAVFQSGGVNVARVDKTGKGFFNGGTQTGGADLAEMFDVEGGKENYEPGDVLVISENSDRTVEKSLEANSTKVAGVFATKPGVTLTEKSIDEKLDQLVPMGVIGVIPTKVCLENGPIKRGDLLVTSSKPGHAMKAISKNGDGVFPSGVILGKALENFDGAETGLIKVLVNVK